MLEKRFGIIILVDRDVSSVRNALVIDGDSQCATMHCIHHSRNTCPPCEQTKRVRLAIQPLVTAATAATAAAAAIRCCLGSELLTQSAAAVTHCRSESAEANNRHVMHHSFNIITSPLDNRERVR
jgi:hypothetical protein